MREVERWRARAKEEQVGGMPVKKGRESASEPAQTRMRAEVRQYVRRRRNAPSDHFGAFFQPDLRR